MVTRHVSLLKNLISKHQKILLKDFNDILKNLNKIITSNKQNAYLSKMNHMNYQKG